jgi:hypothetical protein
MSSSAAAERTLKLGRRLMFLDPDGVDVLLEVPALPATPLLVTMPLEATILGK